MKTKSSLTPLVHFLVHLVRSIRAIIRMFLLFPLVTACAIGPSKSELDAEVKRLCAVDGGIKVYETVKLPSTLRDKYGGVRIPSKALAKPTDEYYYELDIHYYVKGNPSMSRSQYKIIRRRDGKVLGESIRYGRGGGDLPGPWHDSSFTCPAIGATPSLESSVFLVGDDK